MEQTAQTNSPLDNYADRLKFIKAGVFWPWSVSWERIRRLPPEVLGRIDGYIETRVEEYERANVHKKPRS